MVGVAHSLLDHSPIVGHSGGFQFGAMTCICAVVFYLSGSKGPGVDCWAVLWCLKDSFGFVDNERTAEDQIVSRETIYFLVTE